MAKINNLAIISTMQRNQMRFDLPKFHVGDTVEVSEKIIEGKKSRIQKFCGIVLKICGVNNTLNFILQKESYGVFVEKTFFLHSPQIVKIEVLKLGKVRRAYLSYMRNRKGKTIRIKTRDITTKNGK